MVALVLIPIIAISFIIVAITCGIGWAIPTYFITPALFVLIVFYRSEFLKFARVLFVLVPVLGLFALVVMVMALFRMYLDLLVG